MLRTLPPSVSRLSRQCRILNISQPCRPTWLVTRISLLLLYFCYAQHDDDDDDDDSTSDNNSSSNTNSSYDLSRANIFHIVMSKYVSLQWPQYQKLSSAPYVKIEVDELLISDNGTCMPYANTVQSTVFVSTAVIMCHFVEGEPVRNVKIGSKTLHTLTISVVRESTVAW
jgi:hypothetical protein